MHNKFEHALCAMLKWAIAFLVLSVLALASGKAESATTAESPQGKELEKCVMKYQVCCHRKYVCGHYRKKYSILAKYCTEYKCSPEQYKDL